MPVATFALVALVCASPAGGAAAEANVRALVTGWVELQNARSFPEYAKLYSEKFTGVRKSGDKEVRFDHKSWLADRGRMFKKPFKVSIESLEVKPGPDGYQVGFLQKWESSSYADSDPSEFGEVTFTRSANGYDFAFVRELGEGGDERYTGSYRGDGTLETVTQEMEYFEHSMGPANRHICRAPTPSISEPRCRPSTFPGRSSSAGRVRSVTGLGREPARGPRNTCGLSA